MRKIFFIFLFSLMIMSCSPTNNSDNSASNTENSAVQTAEKKIYIDVRTPEEWAEWHVKDAIHIPLSDIQNGIGIEKIPKDTPVHIYCRSGNRSGQAIKILEEKYGYTTNLINAGGMKDLQNVEIVK